MQPIPENIPSPRIAHEHEALTPVPGIRPILSIERLQGMLIGIALGDSLGLAVETMTSAQIAERFGEVRTFLDLEMNQFLTGKGVPIASYSDDAQLSAALFRAYLEAKEFSLSAIAEQHVLEYDRCRYGWGGSTVAGVKAYKQGFAPGQVEFDSQLKGGTGNGIPMKVAALAAWFALRGGTADEMVTQVQQVCSLSHATSISASAGLAHVAGLLYCLSRTPETFDAAQFVSTVVSASALGRAVYPETRTADDLTDRLAGLLQVAELGKEAIIETYGGGDCYVYNSLPFAYAFFLRGPSNPETLFSVINAGGDTDSNAALVGALQGALAGPEIFPVDLVCQVRGLSEILELAPRFLKLSQPTAGDDATKERVEGAL